MTKKLCQYKSKCQKFVYRAQLFIKKPTNPESFKNVLNAKKNRDGAPSNEGE